MVDEAAKAAGYTIGPVYHGTQSVKRFYKFAGTWNYRFAAEKGTTYFTNNKDVAAGYGVRVVDAYLRMINPLEVDAKGQHWTITSPSALVKAKRDGNDGVIIRNVRDVPAGVPDQVADVYVTFNPSQIKSADPVTYDDNGNVIPLSQRFNSRSEDIRNPRQLMGININDCTQDFTGQILRGEKTIETRSTRSLDPYIGERVGLVRTGVGKATLVGYATVDEPVVYDSVAKFRRDYDKHLVAPGSAFDIKDGLKYGYPLMQVESITPKLVQSKGIVARKLNPKDPRSAMTQITGTEDTYIKASKMLGGKVLDYGAGIGIGTDALRSNGLLADSFEPFPENWEGKLPPTYTDSADIPSESYDSMVSFSVINVVDPDERKLLFREVSRILRPDGVALITGRTRQDVGAATTKIPHLEEGGYLIGKGKRQRYQKGFTQPELERYAKEVLGPGFTVEKNGMLNGASIKITKGKTNPTKRNAIRNKLSRIIESDDRILCYDTAADEDFYRLWDIIHTDLTLNKESLREIEGMLDDDGVLVIESGESPAGLQDHFRKTTRYQGLLLVQGPLNPEQARIETEKLRREME